MYPRDPNFSQGKFYADIRGGSLEKGRRVDNNAEVACWLDNPGRRWLKRNVINADLA